MTSAHTCLSFLESPLLAPWADPVTGVVSYILTGARVSPVQQSFYYVNQGFGAGGRYFWFYNAFPPAGSAHEGRTLSVVDFERGQIHHFPETQFTHASPYVDEISGDVYWCNQSGIWSRSANPTEDMRLVNRFSDSFIGGRGVDRIATHLTLSSDRRAFHIDAKIGDAWYIGHAPIDGGSMEIWESLEGHFNFNHAQCSPTDPKLILYAHDHYVNKMSGEQKRYENRIWLIREGGSSFPAFAQSIPPLPGDVVIHGNRDRRSRHGHEWWSADGDYVWFIHYSRGVERVSLSDILLGRAQPEMMWPHPTVAHAHTDTTGGLLVLDSLPPDDPSDRRVSFVDLLAKRQIEVVSYLPEAPAGTAKYHIHPHPRFCLGDQILCYTTTVLGQVDVAFVRVSDLLRITRA